MSTFNILDRKQSLHQHVILEASAGTGKTFAIENLVVRLLIEAKENSEPILLNRILVVTFTKAATRELKERIRVNLEKTLSIIKAFQFNVEIEDAIPDYLLVLYESGDEALKQAQQRLETALFAFDQAQIFTIHGFCWRMLQTFAIEGGVSLKSACSEEQTLSKTTLLGVVKDFMRTELVGERYSQQQISRVLQMFGGQLEKLQSELLQVVSQGLDIFPYPSFSDHLEQFLAAMQELANLNFTSEKILADFKVYVPAYKGICNRNKQIHPEILESVTQFALLFDKEHWVSSDFEMLIREGLVLLEILAPEQLSAKGVPPLPERLNYPNLLITINKILRPIIDQARDPNVIFARMAADCQKLMRYYQAQEEMLGFNDLLQQMQCASQTPIFAKQVRDIFDAAIVDEFQDTDPVQWDIFRRLFIDHEWGGHLYLVGDPKQSIYAFRQADIYTYLSAARALNEEAKATLDTNYRSQPALVDALNVLFQSAQALFPLPREQLHLPYRLVKSGHQKEKHFSDRGASLQFLLAQSPLNQKKKITLQEYEERWFFPAISQEIIRLHREDGVEFNRCAILVADRFQAERLLEFFSQINLPAITQRSHSLADSKAIHAMRELLQGILHYRQESMLKVALGGQLIGMSHTQILDLEELHLEKILHQCEHLSRIFVNEGFATLYPKILQSCWHGDDKSILERLLERVEGLDFYREWQDIAELLIQEQAQKNLSADGLIAFLDEFDTLKINDDERLSQTVDQEKEGVIILTSHVSKGLEFDIVFTLGLLKRSPQKEKLMPVQKGEQIRLEAITNINDINYRKHCEELDAEKMRQLYVALTRAKYRLYIPVAIGCGGNEVEIGAASPLELFLVRLGNESTGQAPLDYEELYKRIRSYDGESLKTFVKTNAINMSLKEVEESHVKTVYSVPQTQIELIPPTEFVLKETQLLMQSFTSLSHNKPKFGPVESTVLAPHDYNAAVKNAHTLPAGNETGILLHTILENIPFDILKNLNSSGRLLPWIRPYIQKTPLESWGDVLVDIVYYALKTPLTGNGPSFCLADVKPKKMLREAEFLFLCQSSDTLRSASISPGYIKGVIDLFFEYEGKYYLLDWKSNWLGCSQGDYNYDKLLSVMEEQEYGLQAQIYVEALRKYIKLFDQRPFEDVFGGVFYLFLRGIGPQTGILHLNN